MHEKTLKSYWKLKETESIEIAADTGNCWNSKMGIESKLKTNKIWNTVKTAICDTRMNGVYYVWVHKWNG